MSVPKPADADWSDHMRRLRALRTELRHQINLFDPREPDHWPGAIHMSRMDALLVADTLDFFLNEKAVHRE